MCLTPESLYQTLEQAHSEGAKPLVEIAGLAGQRVIKLRLRSSADIAKVALAESKEETHVA
jgi:hypothetical protein